MNFFNSGTGPKTVRWRAVFCWSLAALAGLLSLSAEPVAAAEKPSRVAVLLPGDAWSKSVDGLREGMAALGFADGRDVQYIVANAKGDKKKVAELTTNFVAEKVDVLFTITNTALKIVVAGTESAKTPVVFGSASGPVESGILPTYATAGTHVTGVTSGSIELVAKRIEILRDALPKLDRIVGLGDIDSDSSMAAFRVAKETASKLKLKFTQLGVRSKEEALAAAEKLGGNDADAIVLIPGLHAVGAVGGIAAAAMKSRLPLAVYQVEHVKRNGALLSYGSSYHLQGKQSASMVAKILKGVPVQQIPIERPALHELILNLETAKKIGVRFAPEFLHRADELVGPAKP